MTALLEMAAAAGISLFLGIVLTATYAAAAISRHQERMLRKISDVQAEARGEVGRRALQLTAGDGWPQPTVMQDRQ